MPDSPEVRSRKLHRMLREAGDVHTLDDLIEAINGGKMQSFVFQDSWMITQIIDFPRKRVCEIVYMMGHMEDFWTLERKVTAFAEEHNCDFIRSFSRIGFTEAMKAAGARPMQRVFMREV